MIKVTSPLRVDANSNGGWSLTFWFKEFDYTTPFRDILPEIVDALGVDSRTDLRLPAYNEDEDFVDWTLQFGTITLGVYYEHSLGYLCLMSDEEVQLRQAAEKIKNVTSLV